MCSLSHSHIFPTQMCSFSISYKYPWTIGAANPTTVPHSQSHAAGSPAHLDPACQSHSTYPALCHGVSPGGTVGGLGRQHSCCRDGVACPRPCPGKQMQHGPIAFTYNKRPASVISRLKECLGHLSVCRVKCYIPIQTRWNKSLL